MAGKAKFTKDNPPKDDDFTPAAVKYREAIAEGKEPTDDDTAAQGVEGQGQVQETDDKEEGESTNFEKHGGRDASLADPEHPLNQDKEPAPRHFDSED